MTQRRAFTSLATSSLLGLHLGVAAQPVGKLWRLGFLNGGPRPADGAPPAALRTALQALGYVEGKNIAFEGRWGEVRNERLPALAAEVVALKVDVLVTSGGPSAAAAKQASLSTPMVVMNAGDAVETGLVASLGRPGGNVTGVNDPAAELSAKRLEMIKELVPATRRVAVLWNPGDQAMTLRYRAIERAAQVLRVSIEPLGVREPDDFGGALTAMIRTRPDALMMVSDALTTLNRQKVVDFAAANRIPAMYEFGATVKTGGLMSYGSDVGESLNLVASYVDRILKTAKALGLTIPPSLLARVDEVVD